MGAKPAAEIVLNLRDQAATERLAAELAELAEPGDAIGLTGELGAGKTTFARAFIARAAGGVVEVPSPTFNLVLAYPTPHGTIWHFDLYRIEHPRELDELGLEEALADGISLIEWPEKLGSALPGDALLISIEPGTMGPDSRRVRLGCGDGWTDRLEGIADRV